jgi:23S rRNA (adenine2503-C2)-methyltransferase
LVRNLSAAEILAQITHTRDELNEWPSSIDRPNGRDRMFTNIVMMGMGEPLYNYDNVAKALMIAMDEEGIAISKRRITLSTSGVVPMIERCGRELNVNLAISLHAVTDELRDRIMPINRKYPLAELMAACRNYPGLSNARRITFEYVMLKDVNDSDADARALVQLIGDIPAKINLIPFNPWPGAPFERSSNNRIHRFGDIVNAAGFASPVRTPRGEDIMAACGQLKSDSVRESAAQRQMMQAVMQEKEAAVGL